MKIIIVDGKESDRNAIQDMRSRSVNPLKLRITEKRDMTRFGRRSRIWLLWILGFRV